ncbi:MAG: hypothetical protein ABEJ58_09630 [Halodesulfurarchaeum sp.]
MDRDELWITAPLLEVLLQLADDADPRPVNILLLASPAADLESHPGEGIPLESLDTDRPVFSDFYFPDAGRAIRHVFGIDLGTPAGQTQGRFLSHPMGDPDLGVTDDLHARVLVAIPPWTPENVTAYDRHGTKLDVRTVAATSESVDLEK